MSVLLLYYSILCCYTKKVCIFFLFLKSHTTNFQMLKHTAQVQYFSYMCVIFAFRQSSRETVHQEYEWTLMTQVSSDEF